MTATIRARVWKFPGGEIWCAKAYLDPAPPSSLPPGRAATAESWPEAMLLVPVLRTDLDRELMEEVNASRASRRDTRPTCSCAELPGIHPAEECAPIISQAGFDQVADAWARRFVTFNPDQIITTEEPA